MSWLVLAYLPPQQSRNPVVIIVVFLAILFSTLLLMSPMLGRNARMLRVLKAVMDAHRRGDYQMQLKLAEGFRVNDSAPHPYLFYRGSAFYQLGRLYEADLALRRCLSVRANTNLRSVCLSQLGRVYMEQERWEDALERFQESIAAAPWRGSGHRATAELLLRQGVQPESALDFARKAVAADRSETVYLGKRGKAAHDCNVGESLAVFAWALAKNRGSRAEIEGALNQAFALCGENSRPVLASLHFWAGHAYSALGDAARGAATSRPRQRRIPPAITAGSLSPYPPP
jgi:tetratricopeptide (TPR) repeat protein